MLEKQSAEVTSRIEAAEDRIREIDATFAEPDYYERASPGEVRTLESERAELEAGLEELMTRWEEIERELHAMK
jgi:chromosome segregation ATPase